MNPIYTQLAHRRQEQRRADQMPFVGAGSVDVNFAKADASVGTPVDPLPPLSLFFEREDEVSELYRVLNHRKGGRTSLLILHGDGSSGKSTLIQRGLLPKFRREFEGVFLSIALSPTALDDCHSLIASLAGKLIDQLPSQLDRESAREESARRQRHFALLVAGDFGEAAEYLAALFREACSDDGPTDKARCLVHIDPLDRFFPNGLIEAADGEWQTTQLLPLTAFLHEMALTNAFPLILTVRSCNVEGLRSALRPVSKRINLDWKGIDPLPAGSLSALVDEDASLPNIELDLVNRCEELLELHPGALAFLEDTWRAQTTLERPPMTLDFFEEERPLEKIIAGAAETAVASLCADESVPETDTTSAFHALMDMFFPVPEGAAQLLPQRLPYATLATRPAVNALIEALMDARVLHSVGDRHELATIEWCVPRFFRYWQRGQEWLKNDRQQRETAEQLKTDLKAWKNADCSCVLLMHGTASLRLAKQLLDYHRIRPFLSGELRDYFEQSIATDLRLRPSRTFTATVSDDTNSRRKFPATVGDLFRGLQGLFRR